MKRCRRLDYQIHDAACDAGLVDVGPPDTGSSDIESSKTLLTPQAQRQKLSVEERRMAAYARRARVDAAAGRLRDITGLLGNELIDALLRK